MSVLVLLEQRGGLKPCAFEAASAAAAIARGAGLELNAVYIGQSLADGFVAVFMLQGHGFSYDDCPAGFEFPWILNVGKSSKTHPFLRVS